MKNVSLIRADTEKLFSDDHVQVILAYFQGSGNPPNLFFQDHTWILYIYVLICVHGFIMNTFLVNLRNSRSNPEQFTSLPSQVCVPTKGGGKLDCYLHQEGGSHCYLQSQGGSSNKIVWHSCRKQVGCLSHIVEVEGVAEKELQEMHPLQSLVVR